MGVFCGPATVLNTSKDVREDAERNNTWMVQILREQMVQRVLDHRSWCTIAIIIVIIFIVKN